MKYLILIAVFPLLAPAASFALDCTPFQTWDCANQGYYDVLNGQPGEVVCGVDYTGWTLHVVEVTVTEPGWIRFSAISAASSWSIVQSAVLLMDDCGAGTCLDSAQGFGQVDLDTCLDVGTHTFVVASDTIASSGFINIGILCPTCAEAVSAGYDCPLCDDPISTEQQSWDSLKSQYR